MARIHYRRCNPDKRSKLFFYVEFDDGDKVLLPSSKDLSAATQCLEDYIILALQFYLHRFYAVDAPRRVTAIHKELIGILR